MYCHNCGTETTDNQTYCTACGAELVYQSSTADTERDDAATPSGAPDQNGSGDHPDHSMSAQSRSPDREATAAETPQTASTAQESDGAEQARELAGNALFGYSFIVLFRLTGISAILFRPHAENPFFSTGLHAIGVFVFYDGFLLAVIALVASAYLTARHYLDLDLPANTRLDTVATIALSGSSLLYALGIVFALA